jgi:hypothetical protein
MQLSIHYVEILDDDSGEITKTGYMLYNLTYDGQGDVIRAINQTGYYNIPRSKRHPALMLFATIEEAQKAATDIGCTAIVR